jgi:hypothetical protein
VAQLHRLARHHPLAHAGLDGLVGHRGAGALVQVVGPAGDDARRKLLEVFELNASQIAGEALALIAKLYEIERELKELKPVGWISTPAATPKNPAAWPGCSRPRACSSPAATRCVWAR